MLGLIQHFRWKTGHLITAESRVTLILSEKDTNFPKGRAYFYWIEPQKTFCGNKWADGQSRQERSSPVVCFSPARPDAAARDKSFKIWIIHFPISDLSHSSPSGHTNLVWSQHIFTDAGLITVWSVCYQWCSQHSPEDFSDQQKQIVSNNHLTR